MLYHSLKATLEEIHIIKLQIIVLSIETVESYVSENTAPEEIPFFRNIFTPDTEVTVNRWN